MNTLRAWVLALGMLIAVGASAATVWKWVDKNGVVHYSDQPIPGAVRVDLNVQTYEAEEPAATPPASTSTTRQEQPASTAGYQRLSITSPANEETIAGTGGVVTISAAVEPGLEAGHSVAIYLDGQLVSEPGSNATSVQVSEVARGAHTAAARVLSANGQTLIQSDSITFFVFQPSVLRPKK